MKKPTAANFESSYRVRSSIVILIFKIILTVFIFWLLLLLADAIFEKLQFLVSMILLLLNVGVILYHVLHWFNGYYIVSPQGISGHSGVVKSDTETLDMPAIRSVVVKKTIIGRIFGYGTIRLISPLLEKDFLLRNVPHPYNHAQLIEKQRLKEVTGERAENIIPMA